MAHKGVAPLSSHSHSLSKEPIMRHLKLIIGLTAALALTSACGPSVPVTNNDQGVENNNTNTTNNNTNNNQQTLEPALDAIFVGGHLGNYMDCPEDGYTERDSAQKGAPAGQDFAPCEASADAANSCGGPLNCEAAQFTIKLTNMGDAGAAGVSIETIAMLNSDGDVVATLPLIGAVNTDTQQPFDGTLAAGAEVTLRVDFQGPQDISEFIPEENSWSGKAVLEITVGADNHEDVTLKTKSVSVMPGVVT